MLHQFIAWKYCPRQIFGMKSICVDFACCPWLWLELTSYLYYLYWNLAEHWNVWKSVLQWKMSWNLSVHRNMSWDNKCSKCSFTANYNIFSMHIPSSFALQNNQRSTKYQNCFCLEKSYNFSIWKGKRNNATIFIRAYEKKTTAIKVPSPV